MIRIELTNTHPRITHEARTLEAMIGMYCRDQHGTPGDALCADCADCAELLRYAGVRLAKCPFQEHKTTCAKCPVHCYKPARHAQIRAVMRYAGPRMMLRHPRLAFYHLVIDGPRSLRESASHLTRLADRGILRPKYGCFLVMQKSDSLPPGCWCIIRY